MAKMKLTPGFRFHPTDVELIKYYLKRKVTGQRFHFDAIAEVEIYKFAPSDLPDKSCLRTGDLKWYFFCPIEKKNAHGSRKNRTTGCGYWKTTGKDRPVHYNNEVVGMIKTLIFHLGKTPRGERTDWVMHEYRLQDKDLAERNVVQNAYVLCVVFKKDGPGPRNGAQYGAPFREEDWSDDDVDDHDVNHVSAIPLVDRPMSCREPTKQLSSVATNLHCITNNTRAGVVTQSRVSGAKPSADEMLPFVIDAHNKTTVSADVPRNQIEDLSQMLDLFVDDENFFCDNNQNEIRNDANLAACIEDSGNLDANDIFSGLPDLSDLDFPRKPDQTIPTSNSFVELHDLEFPIDIPTGNGTQESIQNYGNNQNRLCFPVDPSSSAAAEHATEHAWFVPGAIYPSLHSS